MSGLKRYDGELQYNTVMYSSTSEFARGAGIMIMTALEQIEDHNGRDMLHHLPVMFFRIAVGNGIAIPLRPVAVNCSDPLDKVRIRQLL